MAIGTKPMTSPDTGRAGEVWIQVTLPFPPSLNDIFTKFKGAHLSQKYRKWRDEAGWRLKELNPGKVKGPVAISVSLVAPDKRVRDLDNCGFKAVIDLLVKHQIIEADDSTCVRKIEAEWASSGAPCTVTIRGIE
jgi:Holliday junction resolvase RusA-like endonuclease